MEGGWQTALVNRPGAGESPAAAARSAPSGNAAAASPELLCPHLVKVDAADDVVQLAAVQQRLHLAARQRRDMRLHTLHAQPRNQCCCPTGCQSYVRVCISACW